MCLGNTQVKMRIISRISFLGQKNMPIVHESKIRLLVISEDTLSEYSKENVCVHTLHEQCLVRGGELWAVGKRVYVTCH